MLALYRDLCPSFRSGSWCHGNFKHFMRGGFASFMCVIIFAKNLWQYFVDAFNDE